MPLRKPITPALLADPEIFQQNRLPFHAHFADQTSPELPLTVSLNGEWNFRYAENLTPPFTDWDTLTVQVYRFSSGSWLEDQDFWRMSGLFRLGNRHKTKMSATYKMV